MHGAQHTERRRQRPASGARRGAATLGLERVYFQRTKLAFGILSCICINAPEGCQHGTHDLFAVIKLTPPVLGIPARPEQICESQARTPNPKRPGIVHSQCVPGAEG